MPQSQAARRSYYQFGAAPEGASNDDAEVLRFQRKFNEGGDLHLLFEAPEAENDLSVTVQVSEDGSTWNDTTAAQNGAAVVDESLSPKTRRMFTISVRPKLDEYIRILARGSDRGGVTVTGNEIQEIKNQDRLSLGGGSGE